MGPSISEWPGPYFGISSVDLKKQDYVSVHTSMQLCSFPISGLHGHVFPTRVRLSLQMEFFSKCSSSHMRNLLMGRCYSKVFSSLGIQLFMRNSSLWSLWFHRLFYGDCTLVAHWPNSICGTALFRLHSALNHFEIAPIFKIRVFSHKYMDARPFVRNWWWCTHISTWYESISLKPVLPRYS